MDVLPVVRLEKVENHHDVIGTYWSWRVALKVVLIMTIYSMHPTWSIQDPNSTANC